MPLKLLRETDARVFQILFLATMFICGVALRDFPIGPAAVAMCLGSVAVTQMLAIHLRGLPWSSLLSAAISGLSLCLLCRSNSLLVLGAAGVLAIASKFLLTWRGKHFFNPTNFGIVALYFLTDACWVSPAQWGEEVVLILGLSIMGVAVVHSAWRHDISLVFLLTFVLLLAVRVTYLGQPWAVMWHQLNSGSLILFTFFMISDPRSTPDHWAGRAIFAAAVALLAYWIRFHLYNPNALLLALFFLSPVTVLLDRVWKAKRFQWKWRQHETALSDTGALATV